MLFGIESGMRECGMRCLQREALNMELSRWHLRCSESEGQSMVQPTIGFGMTGMIPEDKARRPCAGIPDTTGIPKVKVLIPSMFWRSLCGLFLNSDSAKIKISLTS